MAVRKSAAAKPEPVKVEVETTAVEAPEVPERTVFVRRNVDGSPNQTPGFVLVVEENASEAELAAAWNNGGELPPQGQVVEYYPRTW